MISRILLILCRFSAVSVLLLSLPAYARLPVPVNKKGMDRIGSLPFPGVLTNFVASHFRALGSHSYELAFAEDRGNLYSCRGGFLDLGHVRTFADDVADTMLALLPVLEQRRGEIRLRGNEQNDWVLKFRYPAEPFSESERFRVALEVAIELNHYRGIFHEMASWYGLTAANGAFTQDQSAFTYEDVYSHAVGMTVVRQAILDPDLDYNAAMTFYLNRELRSLRVVPRGVHLRAIDLAKRQGWWAETGFDPKDPFRAHSQALKRHTDIATSMWMDPWRVADLAECDEFPQKRYRAPRLRGTLGRHLSQFVSIEMNLAGMQAPVLRRVRAALDLNPAVESISPSTAFPRLMENIVGEMRAKLGAQFNRI